jgi:predicted PurR-regulated permease PerM
MALIDSRASRVLITLLIFALALGFLYTARHTLVAFLFAIFFAYLVDPLVSKLEHLVRGRGRAIAIIYVLLVGVLVVFFTFVGPQIGRQGAKLSQALPQLLDRVTTGEIALSLGTEHGLSKATAEQLKRFLSSHSADIKNLAQRAVQ